MEDSAYQQDQQSSVMMKMKLGTTDKNELIIFDEKAESEVFASMSLPRQAEG